MSTITPQQVATNYIVQEINAYVDIPFTNFDAKNRSGIIVLQLINDYMTLYPLGKPTKPEPYRFNPYAESALQQVLRISPTNTTPKGTERLTTYSDEMMIYHYG